MRTRPRKLIHKLVLRHGPIMSIILAVAFSSHAVLPQSQSPDRRSVIVRAKTELLRPKLGTSHRMSASAVRSRILEQVAGLGVARARTLWPAPTDMIFQHPGSQTFVIEVPAGQSAETLARDLSAQPWVEYAEIDDLLELHAVPNDPLWVRQWDLHNTGQPYWSVKGVTGDNNDSLLERTGIPDADLRFLAAYESAAPTADVMVGVIDTGVDSSHVDLRDRIARNNDEIPGNGIDDDHNGFIDDIFGWDFSGDEILAPIDIQGDDDVADYMGHGTHVAGTIAATVDNGVGIAGVCPHARILGVKIFPNPFFSISAAGIYYAVERGARVINMSWGGAFRSRAIEDALNYAHDRGVVLMASMGNSGREEVFYPGGYESTIGVGSSNARDQLSRYSTFNDFVDLVAPGEDILSLRATGTDLYADVGEPGVHIINNQYLIASGTSMSAPHAAGAAAELLAFAPGLGNERVREILRASADDIVDPYGTDSLDLPGDDRYTGAGRINLERALAMLPGVLIDITSHKRGAQLAGSDNTILGRIEGRNASTIRAELASGHPPITIQWAELAPDHVEITGTRFRIRLPEADTLVGPYTLRVDAGTDAVLDWPLWFGNAAIARIESPVPGDTIRLLRPILGKIYAPQFASYSLNAVGPLPSRAGHPIHTSSTFGWQDTLAYWRTDSLVSGVYDLILTLTKNSSYTDTTVVDSIVVDTIVKDITVVDTIAADTVRVAVRDPFLAGFPVDLPSAAHFAVATVNLDGVGGEEIICPTQSGLYVLQSKGLIYPGWPRDVGVDVSTAPAIADLDRDGKNEIIVASGSYMHVYSFIGEAFAGWPQEFQGGRGVFGNSLPVVGDLDGTGGLEVAAIDRHGQIKVWHANGTVYSPRGGDYFARIAVANSLAASLPRVAVCDLNRDGHADLVAAGDGIYVFDAVTGEPYAGNSKTLVSEHFSVHGLVVGSFDDDLDFEIAYVATEGNTDQFRVHVIDADGSEIIGWPRVIPQTMNFYLQYSLSAADLDGDRKPELLLAPYSLDDGYLYAFHSNGAPVGSDSTNGILASLPGSISTISIVNVDQDSPPEIVARVGKLLFGPDYVYALKPDGELVPGYPIEFGYGNSSTMPAPIIGDLNADGLADMTTVQSTSMSVAVWELGIPTTIGGDPWPRFCGDLWNSSIAPAPRYNMVYLVRMTDWVSGHGFALPPYEPTDINCDGLTDVLDVVLLWNYLFESGTEPCRP